MCYVCCIELLSISCMVSKLLYACVSTGYMMTPACPSGVCSHEMKKEGSGSNNWGVIGDQAVQ